MTNTRTKISALMITFNEEEHIAQAIKTLNFADEIIVIDAMSTDKTVRIASENPKVKVISHSFNNFSEQRTFAISNASNDWVLFLDADERISNNLAKEIENILTSDSETVAYEIYRQFYFNKKPLYYSSFQRDKTFRLFHKAYACYDPKKLVHESIIVNGKTSVLKHKLDHYSYKNSVSYQQKMKHYAELRAKELHEKGLNPTRYHFYIKPAYRFLNMFIFRLGFLDGKEGYQIAKVQAYGVRQRYVELRALKKA